MLQAVLRSVAAADGGAESSPALPSDGALGGRAADASPCAPLLSPTPPLVPPVNAARGAGAARLQRPHCQYGAGVVPQRPVGRPSVSGHSSVGALRPSVKSGARLLSHMLCAMTSELVGG